MTEEEAKTKLCPQFMPEGRCRGRECMAWRSTLPSWEETRQMFFSADLLQPTPPVQEFIERDKAFRADGFEPASGTMLWGFRETYGKGRTENGYCGLAGVTP